jgi:nitrite reductase/ring-hydroxylating ferredoxin subunit
MKRIIDYKDDNAGGGDDDDATFRYLCTVNELPVGKSRQFSVRSVKETKEIQIAVFNVDGKYYCISNKCQHQGGPLSKVYNYRRSRQ